MIRPYPYDRLPALTRDEVDWLSALHRSAWRWNRLRDGLRALVPGGIDVRLANLGLTTRDAAIAEVGAGWFCALVDRSGAPAAYVSIDAPVAQALAGVILIGREPPVPEVRPLLAAETACLDHLAAHLLAVSDVPLRPRAAHPADLQTPKDRHLGRASVHVSFGAHAGWATIWTILDRWPASAGESLRSEPLAGEALWRSALIGAVRRELRVRIGTFGADRRAVLALGVGDVLLPSEWIGSLRPATGRLLFGDGAIADVELIWAERIDCRVTDGEAAQEESMRDDRKGDEPDLSKARTIKQMRPVLADRLELIEIVVGGVTMSLGEVLQLRPGRVFTLKERVDAPVDLVLEGRTIGRAELVEVEGRLGVRILAMG